MTTERGTETRRYGMSETTRERLVTVTDDDIAFVRRAKQHYGVFAEEAVRVGDERTLGIMRKQEFYAERFLLRLTEGSDR